MGAACCGFFARVSRMRKDGGAMSAAELTETLRGEDYTIIDARPHKSYLKSGHPMAINVVGGATQEETEMNVAKAMETGILQSKDKYKLFLVHCDGGVYAASTRFAMQNAGFSNCKNAGGWAAVGNALKNAGKEAGGGHDHAES